MNFVNNRLSLEHFSDTVLRTPLRAREGCTVKVSLRLFSRVGLIALFCRSDSEFGLVVALCFGVEADHARLPRAGHSRREDGKVD